LIKDVRIKAITFTGSTEVGLRIASIASPRLTRIQLEMGGKNACIVLGYTNLNMFTEVFLSATYGVAGQKCTDTSRLIITKMLEIRLRIEF
jgi:aldehyde dehydrogenase (NAD+)